MCDGTALVVGKSFNLAKEKRVNFTQPVIFIYIR